MIDELPPGRTPVVTKLVDESRRDEVIRRIRESCAEGAQAYWVCPLIEESETLQLKTALETFETMKATFPDLAVGLVHGRMKPDEKAQVMADFKAKRVQLLVATTVIEVGVDVPNATLMVIEHAERMGLAQLHQLRGRVGPRHGEEPRDPPVSSAAVGDGPREAQDHLRDDRRLRDRAPGPAAARARRVPRARGRAARRCCASRTSSATPT